MVVVVLTVSLIYALPNIYPEDPSLQISAMRGAEVSADKVAVIEQALQQQQLAVKSVALEKGQILARFSSAEDQLKAREVITQALEALCYSLEYGASDPSLAR